ncbi:hypothetical protein QR685DRAFT_576315 [Neurospora intermedia]|uniref:Uncharacterized protein n=1 Tax=Neurospora intermedia TaxID=5142 RepID=A0ABR3CXP6_NEUIN
MQTACRQPKESDQQRAAGFLFLGHPSMPSSRKQWQPSIRANTTKRRGMDSSGENEKPPCRAGRAGHRRCHATRRQELELETEGWGWGLACSCD